MTTALTVRGPNSDKRDPAKASGRCRAAADHYVKNGCKAIGPSLVYAGFAATTAEQPSKNGYTHDYLVSVARYWNKGSQVQARQFMSRAIQALADMVDDPSASHQARGAAAKTIIDVGKKEEGEEDTAMVAAEEQAKWAALIRHWKRTFLRRGILLGRENSPRSERLLAALNYALGKGPRPEWMTVEEETDGEGVLGPEGDSRPGSYIEAEIVEEVGGIRTYSDPPVTGTGPTDPE